VRRNEAVLVCEREVNLLIRHGDKRTEEAIILSRSEKTILVVAVKGHEDAVVLRSVNGTWTGEDGEPIEVEFEWQRHSRGEPKPVPDRICSKELAARSVRLQLTGDDDEAFLEQRLADLESRLMMESAGHAASQSVN
jgi:hypothetical protein